jgi:hypothetical protein
MGGQTRDARRVSAPRAGESTVACPANPYILKLHFQKYPGGRGADADRTMGQVAYTFRGGCYEGAQAGRTTATTTLEIFETESMQLEIFTETISLQPSRDAMASVNTIWGMKQRLELLGYIEPGVYVWDQIDDEQEERSLDFEFALLAFKADYGLMSGRTPSAEITDQVRRTLDEAATAAMPSRERRT